MAERKRRHGRFNWGFIVVVSALAAAVAIITLAEPMGFTEVPTWHELLAPPERSAQGRPNNEVEEGESPAIEAGGVSVHVIDVGQGDCVLIRTEDSDVLIDAGPPDTAQAVTAYLRRLGVTRLDLVIATHPHADHIGGMGEVLRKYPTERVLMPELPEALGASGYSYEKLLEAVAAKGLRLTRARPGEVYDLGGASLEILGPIESDTQNMNNNSIIARLVCGETSFLFTGDAEAGEEESLLAAGIDLSADVLKAGHHGSKTSSIDDFVRAVNPDIAVISCAWDNSYGHPHRDVLRVLEYEGASVWRTDMDGTVVFTSDGESIAVAADNTKENAA